MMRRNAGVEPSLASRAGVANAILPDHVPDVSRRSRGMKAVACAANASQANHVSAGYRKALLPLGVAQMERMKTVCFRNPRPRQSWQLATVGLRCVPTGGDTV